MANGDKLYTVNDGGTVKVLKDTAGTNALVKAFSITGEDSVAPTGLAILNPENDKSRITSSELILHCKIITSSIYAWIPWVLYANADSNNNVDALRLGFDGDGAYYWWTYDRVKIRINSVSLDDNGNILISGGEGSSVYRYFETSGVKYWVPFLLPSTIKNSRLLTVTENGIEKLTAFNSRLLLQRRGYEQDSGNGAVSNVQYPAWHVPLAIKGDPQGVVDVDDYFDWSNYTGTGSYNKLLASSNNLYNFSFVADTTIINRSTKLSSLLSAWIAPTSYWYDIASSSIGLNPLLNNVLTKATDAKIIIANDGALSQDMTSEYQIPNYRREGYLAVLNTGIYNSSDESSNHVMGYNANMGFFYDPSCLTISHNDHMGVQFTSASYPNLRYALTINTNNAPIYYRANEILIQNHASSPISVKRQNGEVAATIQPGTATFIHLNSPGTYKYTMTDSRYGLSKAITLGYDNDSGRLITVDVSSMVITLDSITPPPGVSESSASKDFTIPHPVGTPSTNSWTASFPSSENWRINTSDPNKIVGSNADFVVTIVPNNGWADVSITVKRENGGGKSFYPKYDSAYVMTVVKEWQ